jgi:hypothetical protein
MGLAPSDEPSSQDHPQRPIDNNTFYGMMLSGLNATRGALELPTGSRSLYPAQEALVRALAGNTVPPGAPKARARKFGCGSLEPSFSQLVSPGAYRPRYLRSHSGGRIDHRPSRYAAVRLVGISWGAYEGEYSTSGLAGEIAHGLA